jgi:hypothetical protein|tara:strand:+ start:281 stop:544 length:264 start_codon:yes stop_codon:yes gene_type:complete
MKRNYRTAYNQLLKMQCPVIEGGDRGEDTFRISAEQNCEDVNETVWADYNNMGWGLFGVNTRITTVLDANGLYAEWINPGVLAVIEA